MNTANYQLRMLLRYQLWGSLWQVKRTHQQVHTNEEVPAQRKTMHKTSCLCKCMMMTLPGADQEVNLIFSGLFLPTTYWFLRHPVAVTAAHCSLFSCPLRLGQSSETSRGGKDPALGCPTGAEALRNGRNLPLLAADVVADPKKHHSPPSIAFIAGKIFLINSSHQHMQVPIESPSHLGIRDLRRWAPSSTNWQQITLADGLKYMHASPHYVPLSLFFLPLRAMCGLHPSTWQHLPRLGWQRYTFVTQEKGRFLLQCILKSSPSEGTEHLSALREQLCIHFGQLGVGYRQPVQNKATRIRASQQTLSLGWYSLSHCSGCIAPAASWDSRGSSSTSYPKDVGIRAPPGPRDDGFETSNLVCLTSGLCHSPVAQSLALFPSQGSQ